MREETRMFRNHIVGYQITCVIKLEEAFGRLCIALILIRISLDRTAHKYLNKLRIFPVDIQRFPRERTDK